MRKTRIRHVAEPRQEGVEGDSWRIVKGYPRMAAVSPHEGYPPPSSEQRHTLWGGPHHVPNSPEDRTPRRVWSGLWTTPGLSWPQAEKILALCSRPCSWISWRPSLQPQKCSALTWPWKLDLDHVNSEHPTLFNYPPFICLALDPHCSCAGQAVVFLGWALGFRGLPCDLAQWLPQNALLWNLRKTEARPWLRDSAQWVFSCGSLSSRVTHR